MPEKDSLEHGFTTKLEKEQVDRRIFYHSIKRLFDFVLGVLGIIGLSPAFLVIAIIIKKDDFSAPVFYKQARLGLNGRKFKIYKFRSMIVDADKHLEELKQYNEIEGAMFKMKDDPRVTKIGKILRKTSLDELPQLINVIRGEMSLVGPRPPLPAEVEEYSDYDKQRLLVVPGCTGLWQVSGRNEVNFNEMVELDLEYIEKSGMWYDLKLILKTIKIMIVPNGAY